MITFDTKSTALLVTLFTVIINLAIAYFNIGGSLACTFTNINPAAQHAAAGLINQ